MIHGKRLEALMTWRESDGDYLLVPDFFVSVTVACPHDLDGGVEWTMFDFAQQFRALPETVADANQLIALSEVPTGCTDCPWGRATHFAVDRTGQRELTFDAPRPGDGHFLSYWSDLLTAADRTRHAVNVLGNVATAAAAVMRAAASYGAVHSVARLNGEWNLASVLTSAPRHDNVELQSAIALLCVHIHTALVDGISRDGLAGAFSAGDPGLSSEQALELTYRLMRDEVDE